MNILMLLVSNYWRPLNENLFGNHLLTLVELCMAFCISWSDADDFVFNSVFNTLEFALIIFSILVSRIMIWWLCPTYSRTQSSCTFTPQVQFNGFCHRNARTCSHENDLSIFYAFTNNVLIWLHINFVCVCFLVFHTFHFSHIE